MGLRILYCENEEGIADFTKIILQDHFKNCEIKHFYTFQDAVTCLQSDGNFDIIISDNKLDAGTGEDLYYYLVSEEWHLPFILCSGDLKPEKLPDELPFIKKPYDKNLISLVENTLKDFDLKIDDYVKRNSENY